MIKGIFSVHVKKFWLLGIIILSMGIGFQLNQSSANAATHHTPSSWRGTYYTTDGDTMNVNTYSIVLNGKTMYKSSWSGWRKLSFARIRASDAITHKHKVYTFNSLAKYGYQSSRQWRLTTKNGKKELINYQNMGYVVVWHKRYAATKVHFRTADNTDFFYNAWSPAYLDMFSDSIDLYNSYKDAQNEDNSIGSFKNSRQQISAKWISRDQQDDILMLKINGRVYYADNSSHDIRPYSAHRESDGIWSNFAPTSKYARLKKGNHVYKGTEWTYYYNDNNDNKTYRYDGHHWKFEF